MLRALLLLVTGALTLSAATNAIDTPHYSVRPSPGDHPAIDVFKEGRRLFRLPLVSGLSTSGQEEKLSNIQVKAVAEQNSMSRWEATADSSLWTGRRFQWTFAHDHIEFQHFATGARSIERCYFFSNGISDRWTNGSSPGVFANTTVLADQYFSPSVNHADQSYFTIAMPQSVGIAGETPQPSDYHPELMSGLFTPPPLFLAFGRGGDWAGIGLGDKPGNYLFNAFEYSGSRYAGASFWVNYGGYHSAASGFASPRVVIQFGFSEYDTLAKYISWIDQNGFGTERRFPNAPWHYKPIFCGWAEQTREASLAGIEAHDLATQAKYEDWIKVLEQRGLPVGTVVIDDKWQQHYGTFDVDEKKWPDMKGFIARQHAQGRHVLLWVPAFHKEGLPKELSLRLHGEPIAADVTNPAYEKLLREGIHHLVADLGVDGFKEDWVGGMPPVPDIQSYAPLFGIEFVRRFQFILHDETHKWRPDALVETQTPNPLMRDSSDVLRLNDIWYGARKVPEMMRQRARIAKIAGWPLVDCDNASSTNLEEWWSYMQQQPSIGIPALYFVYKTETTMEDVPESDWRQLAEIWNAYVKRLAP